MRVWIAHQLAAVIAAIVVTAAGCDMAGAPAHNTAGMAEAETVSTRSSDTPEKTMSPKY